MNKLVKISSTIVAASILGVTAIDTTMAINGHGITVEASKKSKAKAKRKHVNQLIANELKLNQGIANGTMDADGNTIENGTPDPDYTWALTITKITYYDDELFIKVNDGFTSLSKSDKTQVLRYAQSDTATILGDNYKKWADSYDRPDVIVQDKTNVFIARSKVSDPGKFSFFE